MFFDCRAKTQLRFLPCWFHQLTALTNCVGGGDEWILTNYRFLSYFQGQSRPCNYCLPDCSIFQKSVTAPRDAEDTIWAYLPWTPRLYSGGKVVSAFRFANSSSETCMVILVSRSTVTKINSVGGRQPPTEARCDVRTTISPTLRNARLSIGHSVPWPFPTIMDDKDSISGIQVHSSSTYETDNVAILHPSWTASMAASSESKT